MIRRWFAMRDALRTIAEFEGGDNYCGSTVSYYGPDSRPVLRTCRTPGRGRTRDARYTSERWCTSCIAADALGLPPHAHPEGRPVEGGR